MAKAIKEWGEIISQLCGINSRYNEILNGSTAQLISTGDSEEDDEVFIYAPNIEFGDDEDTCYEDDAITGPIVRLIRDSLGYDACVWFYETTLEQERERISKETVRQSIEKFFTDYNGRYTSQMLAHMLVSFTSVIAHMEASFIRGESPSEHEKNLAAILMRPTPREPVVDDIIGFHATGLFSEAIISGQLRSFLDWFLEQPSHDMDYDLPSGAVVCDVNYIAKKYNEFVIQWDELAKKQDDGREI